MGLDGVLKWWERNFEIRFEANSAHNCIMSNKNDRQRNILHCCLLRHSFLDKGMWKDVF